MNNPNAVTEPQPLTPLGQLIKPEQVANVPNLSDEIRAKYTNGIKNLWTAIRSHPEDSPDRQSAHKKLNEVTNSLREHVRRTQTQAQMGQGANGNRPGNPGQPVQDGRLQLQQPGPQPRPELSVKVAQTVAQLQVIVPPQISAQGQEKAQIWVKEMKQRYALQAQKYEQASSELRSLMTTVSNRQREGRPLSQEESQSIQVRKVRLETAQNEAREYVTKFRSQQDMAKQQMAVRDQQSDAGNTQDMNLEAMESGADLHPPRQPSLAEHQGHKDVNSALDAARQQAESAGRNAMSPSNGQPGHPQGNHNSEPTVKREPQPTQPPMEMNTSGPPLHHNSPQVGQPNPQGMPTSQPGPLSHRAAIQAAQSYSTQPNYQPQNSQPPTHGHPQIPNRGDPQNNNVKMPIPKELKIPPPHPVSMGPARPTITGGPSNGAMGQLGQPAIQKHPGYVLEGDGERVLSKKKLQELVRQVTGVGGGEGDEHEGLTPEVEETLLQVADDFVDQVVSSACKLAKLRNSSSLEVRDLQMILERNYNIRVPGYASDELRTVRKVQPTQGWTQKLSAVQAAKVTGGKTDL